MTTPVDTWKKKEKNSIRDDTIQLVSLKQLRVENSINWSEIYRNKSITKAGEKVSPKSILTWSSLWWKIDNGWKDIKLLSFVNSFVDSWKYFRPKNSCTMVIFTLIELTLMVWEVEDGQGLEIKFIVIGNLIKHAAINVD